MAEWVGFQPLRRGRIHAYCPKCGRKGSNLPREEADPKTAELVHVLCDRCSGGCKDASLYFFDGRGRRVSDVRP